MLLNANTPTLEMKETKTQRELFIAVDEMYKYLEACLMTTLNEFEFDNSR